MLLIGWVDGVRQAVGHLTLRDPQEVQKLRLQPRRKHSNLSAAVNPRIMVPSFRRGTKLLAYLNPVVQEVRNLHQGLR